MKMAYNKNVTPKQIKLMESVIDEIKNRERPIRAGVMPCTVPAWGSMRKDEGKDKCEK
jgi:cob(I)alamin adenosyltransferase|tara:strand:+ start:303 stop:476 length:174 start_codon:yes stop_codon:yes gene_type:complete